jgi:hypothetical protein
MASALDTTTKQKTKTIYVDQINSFVASNPENGVLSTCTTAPSNTVTAVFHSYENKHDFFDGKNICTECSCPKSGYMSR